MRIRPLPSTARWCLLRVGLFAVVFYAGCDAGLRSDRGRYVPEAGVARRAVEEALNAWQDSWEIERTTSTIRPVMFVEQQQPPGQRLRGFEILGETSGYENEGFRRFLVRLSLADPEDSVVAAYYVFGQGPVWVYRAEDFDMIMHMDKSMMAAPPSVGVADEESARPEPLTTKTAPTEESGPHESPLTVDPGGTRAHGVLATGAAVD